MAMANMIGRTQVTDLSIIILGVLLTALILLGLPLLVYLCAKMTAAGWYRGKQSAREKNHHHHTNNRVTREEEN